METKNALMALTGLAHDTRLAIFRLLVPAGPDGLAAGKLGEQLGLAPATLSFHLKELRHAELVSHRRSGRTIFYAADYASVNGLIAYLTENCCQGAVCDIPGCSPASVSRTTRAAKKEPRNEKTTRTRRRHRT